MTIDDNIRCVKVLGQRVFIVHLRHIYRVKYVYNMQFGRWTIATNDKIELHFYLYNISFKITLVKSLYNNITLVKNKKRIKIGAKKKESCKNLAA